MGLTANDDRLPPVYHENYHDDKHKLTKSSGFLFIKILKRLQPLSRSVTVFNLNKQCCSLLTLLLLDVLISCLSDVHSG